MTYHRKYAFNPLHLCHVPCLLQGSTQYFKITLDSAGVATAAVTVFSGSPIVYIADQTLYPNASAGEPPFCIMLYSVLFRLPRSALCSFLPLSPSCHLCHYSVTLTCLKALYLALSLRLLRISILTHLYDFWIICPDPYCPIPLYPIM